MKTINANGIQISEISMGCMRIDGLGAQELDTLINTALELGINFFDHADIYGGGKCEEIFAKALPASIREKVFIQSKCGIRSGFFDFSKEHILNSADNILKRLNTDYLDVFLLHRPDALVEPEEVAQAFDQLYTAGKVRHFGVSNQKPMQIELLKKYVKQPIIFDQLQFSATNTGMIDSGLNVNMKNDNSFDHDGSVLDYCRLNDITIQAWSPFQHGYFGGVFLNNDQYPELNQVIDRLAAQYGVTNSTIATAWILRHPAKIQVIAGTTNASRLRDICKASDMSLSREEWYEIYRAAGNDLP